MIRRALVAGVLWAVRIYQRTLSRILPATCRFEPSCSNYMLQAVELHGPFRGVGLGIWRVMRCNPFCSGGYDPVPRRCHARGDDTTAHPKA